MDGNPEGKEALEALTVGAPRSAREALASGVVSIDVLRGLHERSDARSVLDLALAFGSIAAVPIGYALVPHPATAVACVLLAIRNFNTCAQLVHESAHGSLVSSPRLNNAFGNLAATVLGYTLAGFRQTHNDHHVHLNTERDPDVRVFGPRSGLRTLADLVQDLLLITAAKRFLQYFQVDRKTYTVSPWRSLSPVTIVQIATRLLPVALTQLALLALFAATAGAWFYLFFHLLPIVTLYPFQIHVRSIAEHAPEDREPRSGDEAWVTRSSRLNPLEWLVMAPLGQHHHYEHHVFPSVPHYNLAKVRAVLEGAGVAVPMNRSYFGFVARRIASDLRRKAPRPDGVAA